MTAATDAGRYSFDFNLKVVAAPICSDITASLDIVND
jgi:hypothetical protein